MNAKASCLPRGYKASELKHYARLWRVVPRGQVAGAGAAVRVVVHVLSVVCVYAIQGWGEEIIDATGFCSF